MAMQKRYVALSLAHTAKPTMMGKQLRERLLQLAPKFIPTAAKLRSNNSGTTRTPSMTTDSKAVDSDTGALSEMPTEFSSELDGFSSWDSSTETSEDGRHSGVSPRPDSETLEKNTAADPSLGTLAKLPRNSFDTTPGSKFAPETAERCPPVMMNVIAPGAKCQGTYDLSLNQQPNGEPLWKHQSEDFWLFSTPGGRWAIGGKDVMEDGFARSSGWIFQERNHHGQLPERVPGAWQQWNGTDFEPNPDIVVVVPWRVAKAVKKQL